MDFLLTKIDESWDTPANLDEKMNVLKRKLEELNALKEDTESRMRIELHPRKKLKKEAELWFRKVERINGEIQDLEQKFGESNFVRRGFLKGNVFKKIQEVEELFQQGNLANLDEKMNDLKRKWEVLNALKEDMELHPRKKLKKEVELWFRNVERINGEIQDLEQKFRESNVASRGFLKGNAFKKIQEVEELFQQGKGHVSLVVENPGWIGQALSTTNLVGVAAKTCMEEIWAYLMGDDVQKIGVWGMGGIGKTTIMKLVHDQLLYETEKFNIVIWITVSKEMTISKLQKRIASAMNVLLDEDEDETRKAGRVYEMLVKKGRYVLILDDLWDKLSLEEVGIPEPSNGSKVLVTTRLLDVCHHLNCREVRVPTLSRRDARELFLEKVGQDVLNYPNLFPIVDAVADECEGLPLAIVTIASYMKGVCSVHEWMNVRHEFNNLNSVNGMADKVFQRLKFSYDRLRHEEVKNCFLCCALYPKDFEIDTDELIKLWIAEGLLEEMDSMQIEIDKGHTILNMLKNSCLIEDGNSGGVKLHGIVRGMALRITSVRPRFLVRAGMQLKEILDLKDWSEDLEKASLMENRVLQIPSQMPAPNCPKLTTLLLSNSNIVSIPECFFEQMHVLKILDLSYNCIKSLPNSISNLKTLTALLLGGCKYLEKVPSFSKLEALNKLDLGFTKIKDIPHGMERLVNLKYLDLSWTGIKEMGDGILEKFTSLQLLNLDDMLMRGEEVGGLRKLEFVNGRFYDLNEWNNYVQALHAQKRGLCQYAIFLGPVGYASLHERDKVIGLNGCSICTDGIKILSNVEELNIFKCIDDWCEEGAFLSRFIPVPLNFFSSLSRIQIIECNNIKKVFSSNWVLHNLQNLVELFVVGCEKMEEIISSELEEEGISCTFIFTLPRLRRLVLWSLPELKSICGANGVMVCDSVEHIDILECPKIKRIPLNLPLQDDGQPSPPPSLISIRVYPAEWWKLVEWDHPNAKSILEPFISERILAKFTSSKKLVRGEEKGGLRKSEIFKVSFYDLNELNNNVQALHELRQYRIYVGHQAAAENESYAESEKFIELNGCNICKGGSKILSEVEELRIESCIVDSCEEEAFLSRFILVPRDIFSSLSRIEIIYCQNIKKLFSSNWVLHNLQNLNILCVRGCKEMEEIIASESELEEEVKFPKLCWLELYDLPELKSICSASGVMVCDSIEKIYIGNCPNLKRIPLNLPLRDDGQPSPPPFLRTINAYPEEWWELVEWDHPNVKSLLEPYVENWPVL